MEDIIGLLEDSLQQDEKGEDARLLLYELKTDNPDHLMDLLLSVMANPNVDERTLIKAIVDTLSFFPKHIPIRYCARYPSSIIFSNYKFGELMSHLGRLLRHPSTEVASKAAMVYSCLLLIQILTEHSFTPIDDLISMLSAEPPQSSFFISILMTIQDINRRLIISPTCTTRIFEALIPVFVDPETPLNTLMEILKMIIEFIPNLPNVIEELDDSFFERLEELNTNPSFYLLMFQFWSQALLFCQPLVDYCQWVVPYAIEIFQTNTDLKLLINIAVFFYYLIKQNKAETSLLSVLIDKVVAMQTTDYLDDTDFTLDVQLYTDMLNMCMNDSEGSLAIVEEKIDSIDDVTLGALFYFLYSESTSDYLNESSLELISKLLDQNTNRSKEFALRLLMKIVEFTDFDDFLDTCVYYIKNEDNKLKKDASLVLITYFHKTHDWDIANELIQLATNEICSRVVIDSVKAMINYSEPQEIMTHIGFILNLIQNFSVGNCIGDIVYMTINLAYKCKTLLLQYTDFFRNFVFHCIQNEVYEGILLEGILAAMVGGIFKDDFYPIIMEHLSDEADYVELRMSLNTAATVEYAVDLTTIAAELLQKIFFFLLDLRIPEFVLDESLMLLSSLLMKYQWAFDDCVDKVLPCLELALDFLSDSEMFDDLGLLKHLAECCFYFIRLNKKEYEEQINMVSNEVVQRMCLKKQQKKDSVRIIVDLLSVLDEGNKTELMGLAHVREVVDLGHKLGDPTTTEKISLLLQYSG